MPNRRVCLAAPHPDAVDAARQVLTLGGNAVDAALAAAAALTVVYPHQCSLGGDLIALIRTPDGRKLSINASGAYGSGIDPAPLPIPQRGPLSVSVPGVVSGWRCMLEVAGSLPARQILSPAVELAERGTAVGSRLASAIAELLATATPTWHLRELLSNSHGQPLERGALLRQPALAHTLRALAENGLQDFYAGTIADRLGKAFTDLDIPIRPDDLSGHDVVLTAPLEADIGECRVITATPNSQGYILLTALKVLERIAGSGSRTRADDLAHVFAYGEARRERELADPAHMTADIADLLSEGSIITDADSIALSASRGFRDSSNLSKATGDTVAVTAVSDDGTAVSLIQSLFWSFGSGVHDPSTGITFHNRASSFAATAESPNAPAARKRPAHTLMPVIVEFADGRLSAHGAMGGHAQPQIHTQVLRRVLDGHAAQEAVAAPRFIVESLAEPDALSVRAESDLDPRTLGSLALSGLPLHTITPLNEDVGHAMICTVAADGTLDAGADPRSDGRVLTPDGH
ncbi:gamma-glutamyltransferase [Nocardioides sp. CER19]|uniref:gamma-glutamyltransferase family protein n=1 Tax=Nocardioides sp. CER19 TaxID=3038538 RepID=UPI00244AE699|nr:gamma-glutamyltransferase [Nocardioides sp. CER19]MDH2416162.1 gamma-glutamyltransferase [Nocardioides sp. CER19]